MTFKRINQRGIGMIEVLASLVVLAAGLLSVATLHTKIINQSHESKAKNEAIAIAQARIEELRNYSADVTTEDEFNTEYAVITKGNSTGVSGINAAFTRKESIADANNVKELIVYVSWSDRTNDAQEVSLNSSVGWQKPRSVGDSSANDDFEALVPSATGRARLGDGTIDLEAEKGGANLISNGDLMWQFNSQDGDYRLVDGDGTIVLTLLDACDLGTGQCTEFVRISGKVYIDKTTQNRMIPGDVFVKASDAAFCQQYYIDGNGDPQQVESGTTTALQTTPYGDYAYYNYTCYLGGGWHGNIGIILDGGLSQSDKICQGDPTSANAFEQPKIAARRVYRGMTYKIDGNGDPIRENGDIVYYSIGIADALELPVSGASGHDFVISSLNVNDTTGDKCISEGVMVRTDSYDNSVAGALFEGVPTDFFCFNQDSSFIDNFDAAVFEINPNNTCPFDPSDPPSERHVISGTVLVNTNQTIDSTINAIYVNTSDGAGNCSIDAFTKPTTTQYSLNYSCDVYDWGSGWDGYIQLNTDYGIMACSPFQETFTGISSDQGASGHLCTTGSILTVAGNVTPNGNKVLTLAQTSDAGGQCTVAADGASYSCYSDIIASGAQWTGTLSFVSSNGSKLCISDPILATGSFSILDGTSENASIYLAGVDSGVISLGLQVIANNGTCP